MRNLKKVLSLTLALVMMLGMMTFAGAAEAKKITAADFKDMDKVENKEAVSLLVDLGILNGIKAADGTYTFNPAGNIERGAYAKMIFAVMMNKSNADVYKGSFTGLTDVKGHWAEGYIAYCVSTKIASGNTDKTFAPAAPIKTVTAAKMLLTGLGYNAKLSHYENDPLWAINVMKDAQNAGLLEGVKTSADENLTRDAAAQMIFNALFADQKLAVTEHDMGIEYLKNYTNRYTNDKNLLGQFVFDLKAPITGIVTGNEANTSDMKGKTTIAVTNAGTYKTTTTLEDLGKEVVFYQFGSSNTTSTFAFPTSKNHVYTVPTGLSTADKTTKWLNTNGLSTPDGSIKAFHNYNYAPTVTLATAPTGVANDTNSLWMTKNNVVTSVIDNTGDGKIDVLLKATKALDTVTGAVKTKTAADGTITTLVPGVVNSYETVVGAEGLKKDDRVMWIKVGGTYFVTKCATVEGKLTGSKGTDTIHIDKVAYTISDGAKVNRQTVSDYAKDAQIGYDKTATFYLDENKNVIDAVKIDATTTSEAVVVIGYDKNPNTTTAEYDTVGTAKLLFADGTIKVVKAASFMDKVGSNAPTDISGTDVLVQFKEDAAVLKTNFVFATYSVDKNGNYDLTVIDKAATDTITATIDDVVYLAKQAGTETITPGKAKFSTAQTDVIGNDKTVFLVTEFDATSKKLTGVKSYTGIGNVPKFTGATAAILNADGIASLVVVTAGTATSVGKESNYVFVAKGTDSVYDAATETFTYAGYLDGVKADIKVAKAHNETFAGKLTKDYVCVATLDADKIVIDTTDIDPENTKAGIEYLNGVVKAGSDYYTYTSDVQVNVINDGELTTIDVANIEKDGNDVVYLGGKDIATNKASVIYIVKTAVAGPATLTVAVTDKSDNSKTVVVNDSGDLLTKTIKVTEAAATDEVKVTAGAVTNATVTVTISGAGDTVSATGAATYKLVGGDMAHNLTVKVVVAQDGGADYTKTYTVAVVAPV